MAIRQRWWDLLKPYMADEEPTERGEDNHLEIDIFCPLHEDSRRSAGINLDAGVWKCLGCEEGGSVESLIKRRKEWRDPSALPQDGGLTRKTRVKKPTETVTEAKVQGWVSALQTHDTALEEFVVTRGVSTDTLRQFEIGWDRDHDAYTIPIRDGNGGFWNVRRYQTRPKDDRRKIWSINGMGAPRLYPMQVVLATEGKPIVLCEGEWDALYTIQNGFDAVTRTGSATTWKTAWNEYFKDRIVYICQDCDDAGAAGTRKVARALRRVAAEVRLVQLPYPRMEKHGKDLTDFWQEGHTPEDFQRLLDDAELFDAEREPEEAEAADSSVLASFDSRMVGKPLRLTLTIKGRRDPGYSVPRKVNYACTQDAGTKCAVCPLNNMSGDDTVEVSRREPVLLELAESTSKQVADALRLEYGIPKCTKLEITIKEHQAIEVLFARPSVDHTNGDGAYKSIKIMSVGKHDTLPNNTVQVTGALFPEPRKQLNEFLAWQVTPLETSLDGFDMDARSLRLMKRFQPRAKERPLKKLGAISRELSAHVTQIYGRPEMHAMIDLVWHSVIAFDFDGKRIDKGWLEALIVGDTRTGKSEVASKLASHYAAGEIVSCESASFAGIVGGLQQYGSNKEWAINWGAIPINDRRLVVLDEISGLSTEEIASMSSVRSTGIAELTKIQQEKTHARTRLLWLGNPRNKAMNEYTYGVQAIRPLIGNVEDVARFDIAMSVRAGEVSADEINKEHNVGEQRYTAEACRLLVRWVWSRKPEQVVWAEGAEAAVYEASRDLGDRYIEDPPLIQVANVRTKVARLAVAMAARTFSTDDSFENIIVERAHVEDAVTFFDMLYSMPGFGYAERSQEMINDRRDADKNRDEVRRYLRRNRGLSKQLRAQGSFRRQDLEELLDISREEANSIIQFLYSKRMVRKEKGDVKVEPALHALLRGVKR